MATAAPATAELCMLEAPPVQMGIVAVDAGGAGGGTTVVVQGVMMVTVASLQVVSGSSHLVHGMVVVHPTVTHSVAEQVIVVVHQSQTGRVVGW